MKKTILSLFLVVSILASLFTPTTVIATTNQGESFVEEGSLVNEKRKFEEKSNFIFFDIENFDDVKYIYEQNGKKYFVKESTTPDFSLIDTKIYIIGNDSNELVEEYTTYFEKKEDKLVINRFDNDIKTDSITIDLSSEDFLYLNGYSTYSSQYNGPVYYDGRTNKYYTGWDYKYTDLGSNIMLKFTLTVVVGILAGIAGVDVVTSGISGGLAAAASFIIEYSIATVYWRKEVYELHQITYPERRYYGSFIGLKIYSYFYSDSSRSNAIGSEFYEWRDPVEWPTGVSIPN